VHYFARAAYEGVGRRHPLPKPTNDDELRGRRPRGFEQRLSAAQARLGLRQLKRLEENLAHRRRLSAAYERALRPHGVRVCEPRPEAEPSLVRYPVWTPDRDAAVAALDPYVVAGTWFTSVMEEAVDPTTSGYVPGSCPQAEAAARHLVNLPTHGRVTTDDVPVLTQALLAGLESGSDKKADTPARQP
jgi:dTDP-4-amino-4,6-dideoxygalactose transaminase